MFFIDKDFEKDLNDVYFWVMCWGKYMLRCFELLLGLIYYIETIYPIKGYRKIRRNLWVITGIVLRKIYIVKLDISFMCGFQSCKWIFSNIPIVIFWTIFVL